MTSRKIYNIITKRDDCTDSFGNSSNSHFKFSGKGRVQTMTALAPKPNVQNEHCRDYPGVAG